MRAKVKLTNTSGNENGLLVDGQFSSGFKNDKTYTSSSTSRRVGKVKAGTHNEVIAFTNRRPVAIKENAGWTSSSFDRVIFSLDNEIGLHAKVWIVKRPYNTQRQKAIDACITTAAIWRDERMGLRFSNFEIVDATGDSNASTYFNFNCSKKSGIETDIGKTNGIINIYYVDRVDGGTGRGQACNIGSDFVAMASNTGDELLSHELGHDFALTHIDTVADYDQTNVMHSASNTRQYLTEGQTFRAHVLATSAINDPGIYNARPGKPTRNCPQSTSNTECVQNNKRIWADGTAFRLINQTDIRIESGKGEMTMNHIKTISFTLLFTAMLFTHQPVAWAQDQELTSFMQLWLLDNCDMGEQGAPEKMLLTFGPKAEDILIRALEEGPDKKLLDEQSRALERKWSIRQQVLDSGEGEALGKDNWELARNVNKEDYFKLERNSFVLRYRDRAIQGLKLVGTERAVEVLKKYATDPGFELRAASQEALDRVKAEPNVE